MTNDRCFVCLKNVACPEEGIDSASETPVKKESTCSTVGKKMDSLRSGDRSDLGWVPVGSEVTAVSFRFVASRPFIVLQISPREVHET